MWKYKKAEEKYYISDFFLFLFSIVIYTDLLKYKYLFKKSYENNCTVKTQSNELIIENHINL